MDFLTDLNESQRKAAEKLEGPMMVIAGAGSGKTRVLTYRIANLIKNRVDPFKILSLTFTNKAAREMKARIAKIIGGTEAKNIWMGTFHSIFARILRFEADKLGYPSNFTIYDTQDSKSLIRSIIKEKNLDDKIYKPGSVFSRISNAKNNLIGPEDYMNNEEIAYEDAQSGRERTGEIYRDYALRCFKAGAMDFDDLLYKTNVLFRDFPEALYKYQHKFDHVLVDEYQDTNYSQYLIVKKIAAVRENICVVGDDAQSIYSFRGANIQNILSFQNDYPECEMFKLEQNYRSTKTIVEAANSIIAKNEDQIEKKVWTQNDEGGKIQIVKTYSDNEEGAFVADQIFQLKMDRQKMNSDFAILYRTNAQSRSLEEALRKINIPYKIYGGLSFYQRKEIKDLLSYFRLVCNPNDEEALKRVINYPARGIGKTTMDRIALSASENEVSLWDVINKAEEFNLKVNSSTKRKLIDFTVMIKRFAGALPTANAYDLGYEIAKHVGLLKDLYTDKTPEGVARYENIQELLNGLKEFSETSNPDHSSGLQTLGDYLLDVALLTDADSDSEDPDENDHVSLMTIHMAKGLEFPFVNIVGMEENLFPSQMSMNSRKELEEERRLFYVAVTRAKEKATISFATSRFRWGNLIYCEPSRFIEEIDESYIDYPDKVSDKGKGKWEVDDGFGGGWNKKPVVRKPSQFKPKAPLNAKLKKVTTSIGGPDPALMDLEIGVEVKHDKFGKGKVVKLEGERPNTTATVFFPKVGKKRLLLKFAKLKVLD
ncbi:MAG: UvrD-helicase domain-containing protein [Flavobacteriales bacterium]|nr:UvrD-helicase domain-containing protein [Flavobacteriales bacterium]